MTTTPAEPSARDRALGLVMRHGRLATAFQIIEPGYRYFFDPHTDAVTAFVRIKRWRVVCGMPVSSVADLPEVAARFVADCAAAGEKAAFFGVEQPFLDALAAGGVPADSVQIAEQPEWDPRHYNTTGGRKQTLRGQINRARNKGVTVRQWQMTPGDPESVVRLKEAVADVLDRWLSSRRMSIMRFMVNLEPFDYPEHRRYFVAERHGRPIGFLAAVPVPARNGLFFEDVIRAPEAPNGTAELLIHTAFEAAAEHGDAYATLGMAPLAGVPAGAGPHRLIRGVLRLCYARLTPLYAFAGLRRFKARFHPDGWVPQYLVTCEGRVGVGAFQAALTAFAGGGLLAFGWDTARRLLGRVSDRRWSQGLATLAALLVPWTVLLAGVDGARWFGDDSIRWAWVHFDAAMVVALLGLSHLVRKHPSRRERGLPRQRSGAEVQDHTASRRTAGRLALFLSGATLADFVLSSVQAFNLHWAVTGWQVLVVLGAVLGPLVATLFLWGLAFRSLPEH